MIISHYQNYVGLPCHTKNTSFKQGLTQATINRAGQIRGFGYADVVDKLNNLYGIDADVCHSNIVAFCVEETAKIMSRAGFRLPAKFSFEPILGRDLGRYYKNDIVCINSNYDDFLDLEEQNRLAEFINSFGIGSKHFMDTYLHEFSHAAHAKNLLRIHGQDKGSNLFWKELPKYSSENLIMNPIKKYICKIFPKNSQEIIDKIFINENDQKIFKIPDLTEYFAQKNTRLLVNKLGRDFIIAEIDSDIISGYKGFPVNYDVVLKEKINKLNSMLKSAKNNDEKDLIIDKIAKEFSNLISYYDGEIWNGNIEKIKKENELLNNAQ